MSTTPTDPRAHATRRTHEVRPNPRASRIEGRAADLSVVLLTIAVATVLLVGSFTMVVRGQQVPGPQFFPLIVSGLLFVTGIILLILVLRPSHRPEEVDPNPNISRVMIEELTEFTEHGPRAFTAHQVSHGSTAADATLQAGGVAAAHVPVESQRVQDEPVENVPVVPGGDTEVAPAADPDTAFPLDWRTVLLTVGAVVVFIVGLNLLGWIISAALMFWIIAYAFGSKRPVFDIGIALLISSLIQLVFSAGLGLSLPAGFVGGLF